MSRCMCVGGNGKRMKNNGKIGGLKNSRTPAWNASKKTVLPQGGWETYELSKTKSPPGHVRTRKHNLPINEYMCTKEMFYSCTFMLWVWFRTFFQVILSIQFSGSQTVHFRFHRSQTRNVASLVHSTHSMMGSYVLVVGKVDEGVLPKDKADRTH